MTKMAILIDGNTVTVVREDSVGSRTVAVNGQEVKATDEGVINPATGQPMTGVAGYVSELAGLLTGRYSTTQHVNPPTYSTEKTGETQILPFIPGQAYDHTLGPLAKYAYTPARGELAQHFLVPAGSEGKRVSIKIFGQQSGEINGGVQYSLGARGAPGVERTTMEGNLSSYGISVDAVPGETINLYTRIDSGDLTLVTEAGLV